MNIIEINGYKENKFSTDGNYFFVMDEKNGLTLRIQPEIFERFLGKIYHTYLITEKVTIVYEFNTVDNELNIISMHHESRNWIYYGDIKAKFDSPGKWMIFFDKSQSEKYISISNDLISNKILTVCKHTDFSKTKKNTGVLCMYIDGSDIQGHKKILSYLVEKNLVRKTKSGRYYDMSFKFDYQTLKNEYGASFNSKIKLSDFIDLNNGYMYKIKKD